ncbi:DUF3109 family protein [bacterium]|nr:DUF3109 family protein [bacterium]
MVHLGRALISDEVFNVHFLCDLNACKGACCVEGEAGAPLLPEEATLLEGLFDRIRPYLRPEGIQAIEEQGTWVFDSDGEHSTPLREGAECAYTVFENGKALCGIERAHADGAIDFKKPLSCHLYPIRVTRYKSFDALNYHQWPICAPACSLGSQLKVTVFRFLKEPLIRLYGPEWYDQLEDMVQSRDSNS